jgi:hypothetical protein
MQTSSYLARYLQHKLLYIYPEKIIPMKKLLLLFILTLTFVSCEKGELNEEKLDNVSTKVIGEWELYRDENLESIIDEWTGTEWTYIDQWFQNTRDNSEIILEFKEDGTFVDRYANVPIANGVWGKLEDGRYYFDYVQEENNTNGELTQRRFITFYCDNTYSIKVAGNERAVYYFRMIGTTECSDLINYNVSN